MNTNEYIGRIEGLLGMALVPNCSEELRQYAKKRYNELRREYDGDDGPQSFLFSVTVVCPECEGRGWPVNDRKDACSVCAGEGAVRVKEEA